MSQLPFIIYNPERETSGQSSARVHAARIAYWRRREQTRFGPDQLGLSQARGPLLEGVILEEGAPEALSPLQQAVVSRPPSPGSILGQGRIDPFGCTPGSRLPENVRRALEYAWEVAFPAGTSTTRLNASAPITQFWKHQCTISPTLLHMQLQLAIEIPTAQSCDRQGSMPDIAARHRGTAYRLMRMEIQDFERSSNNIPSDALILALFSSNFLSQRLSISPQECHPASPLATAQMLQAYGRVPLIPGHTKALHNLVEKRGGLANLRQGGIADLIQLHDLRTASQTGEEPLFPWTGPSIDMATTGLLYIHEDACQPLSPVSTGLEQLRAANVQLWEVLTKAGEVTIALDHYQRSGCLPSRLQAVIIAANSVQHALRSLPPAQLLDDSATENSVYEICRLAGLIYSDMVLFPLPACTGVKLRLADEMRTVLETSINMNILDAQDLGLVLWAIFLATIAATFSQHRRWFVSMLAPLVVRLVVPFDYSCFKNMMRSYLWWEPVFDEPASTIWNEVCTETGSLLST